MKKISLMTVNDLGNDLIISEKDIKKAQLYSLHWHNYFELEIVVSGCAEHVYNQRKYIASAGNAYILSYYDFHSFKAIEDTKVVGIRFNDSVVNNELIKYISAGIYDLNCMFERDELEDILHQIAKMEAELRQDRLFGRLIVTNTLSELIIGIIRRSNVHTEKPVPQLIQQAVSLLLMNFRDESISLRAISERLNVSVNYLGFLFQSTMGISFREYLNMLRIKYACRLLLSSQMSVKEIAYASGYKTGEHFMRRFKQKLGMTPSEYRCSAEEIPTSAQTASGANDLL